MSEEEETIVLLLKLYDFYWFERGVFRPTIHETSCTSPAQLQIDHEVAGDHEGNERPMLNRVASTLMRKSLSDQCLTSSFSINSSPKSVLTLQIPPRRQLQTILSGKEVENSSNSPAALIMKEDGHNVDDHYIQQPPQAAAESDDKHKKRKSIFCEKRRRTSASRSMSELEYEELKGFMDLGFVFSEDQEKDSRLVSIIPGLQRLGKLYDHHNAMEEFGDQVSVSTKPYLSQAWDFLEDGRKKEMNAPMADWRIPAFGNEMELKHHLRFWAHTVASSVR